MKCVFCASGLGGLERNLSVDEILEQALWLRHEQGRFGRVVVMGMGEAGHNLDATFGALEALIDAEGMGLSARRVTLSTVGPHGALARIAATLPDRLKPHELRPLYLRRSDPEERRAPHAVD